MGNKQRFAMVSLVATVPQIYGQSLVTAGGDECPVPLQTVAYVYPAVYSQYFQTAGTIFNFMGGTNSLVIEGPTTIITTTMVTSTSVVGPNGTGTQTDGEDLASTTSKRSRSRTSQSATTVTANATTSGVVEPTDAADCPDSNGEVVDGYYIACSIGSNGNNIDGDGLPAASFEACVERCNVTNDCVAVSYQNDISNGPCYLYDRFDSFNTDPQFANFDIAVLYSVYQPSATSGGGSSISSTVSGRSSSNAASSEFTSTAVATTVSTEPSKSNSDPVVETTTSGVAASSSGPSEETTTSVAATTADTTAATTTITSSSSSTPAANAICPDADAGSNYEDYYIYCRSGMNGNTDELPGTGQPASTFAECIQRCTDTDRCIGVSYPNDVVGGNCYLYSTYEKPGLNPDFPTFDIAIKQDTYNAGPTDPAPPNNGGQCDICQNPDGNRDETVIKGYFVNCTTGASGTPMNLLADNGKLVRSLCECIDLCDTHRDDGCVSVSHVHEDTTNVLGACYLMSSFAGFDSGFLQFDSAILEQTYNDYLAANPVPKKRSLQYSPKLYGDVGY